MGANTGDTSAGEQAAAQPAVTAAAPPLKVNNGKFTKGRKQYDPLSRPFHRLNARTYDQQVDTGSGVPGKVGPSGLGRECGCRNSDDFKSSVFTGAIVGAVIDGIDSAISKAIPGSKEVRDALEKQFGVDTKSLKQKLADFLSNLIEGGLFGGFLKFIPSWVPVNRQGFGPTFAAENGHNVDAKGKEAEVEIEGRLGRSYQTHHHPTYTQWSHYYHWAFHVIPSPGFNHLVRKGKLRNTSDNALLGDQAKRGIALRIYEDPSGSSPQDATAQLECLLDIGAFSKPPGDTGNPPPTFLQHPGIFYDSKWPFWPQSGDWFWATGRYVYDCTHVTDGTDDKGKKIELHPTLINPVKAFATARYEAALFDESDDPIPVTRFSFFACRKGGYYDFDGTHLPFTNEDYEFAVDLPPVPSGAVSYDIGALGDFELNTLVIRPRLLKKIEFAPYGASGDTVVWHREPPIIEIVRPKDGEMPRMVKITVPMKTVPKNTDGYGFTISFGWLAPGAPTGVRKVTVKLAQLKMLRDRDDMRMTVCVNGRMVFIARASPSKDVTPTDALQNFPDDKGIELLLPPEKGVRVTAHGFIRNGFGKFLEQERLVDPKRPGTKVKERTDDRRLAVGGIFNVDPDLEEKLKKAAEQKLSDVIPPELLGKFKNIEKILDDDTFRKLLGKAVDDFVGQRRIVVWDEDVDFQESDANKRDEIACAVAREMSVFPVGLFKSPNAPLGFIENGDNTGITFPGDQSGFLDMRAMESRLQATKSAITSVDFSARRCEQASDSEFIVFVFNQAVNPLFAPDTVDYELKVTATIADPDPPK